jgi:hypothetical protein
MHKIFAGGLLLAATLSFPALAQTADPVDPQMRAGAAALNNQVAADQNARAQRDAAAQAQYDADRESYLTALMQHDAAVDRTDARYVRQQVAYADAMEAWRFQVAACKKGKRKACDMPPPNPADYY